MRLRPRLPAALAASALVLLAATGCGGDDEPAADPTTTSSATASTSPGSDASPSDGPTSTYDGVAPATGPSVSGSSSVVHAPEGWSTDVQQDSQGGNIPGPDADIHYNVLLDDQPSPPVDDSTDAMAAQSQEVSGIDPPLERQDDVVVAGVPAYHLSGFDDTFGTWTDEFGFAHDGHAITVAVSTPRKLPEAERAALVGSVLASFRFTG